MKALQPTDLFALLLDVPVNCFSFLFLLGIVTDDLKALLETNVPCGKKASKVLLGVSDNKVRNWLAFLANSNCILMQNDFSISFFYQY